MKKKEVQLTIDQKVSAKRKKALSEIKKVLTQNMSDEVKINLIEQLCREGDKNTFVHCIEEARKILGNE